MDISQVCQLCKIPNDQMLMLACPHDPCINCAASAYAELIHIKNDNPNIFICQICGQSTALDTSTVKELKDLSKSYVKLPSPPKNSTSKMVGRSGSFQTLPNTGKSPAGKNSVFYCKIHAEEEMTYYCFTCHENICPQCAIHGSHKDHEVKLIKKAINEVKSEFLDVISKIGASQNNMNKYRDFFARSIKESNQRNSREKSLVSQQFELLRNLLTNQQKQIIRNLDIINKQNVTILTTFVDDITKIYDQIDKNKRQVEAILKKDEVMIFEEFKTVPKFEQKVEELKKRSQEIMGEISLLNSEFLQQQTKQLAKNIKSIKLNTKKEKVGSIVAGSGGIKNVRGQNT